MAQPITPAPTIATSAGRSISTPRSAGGLLRSAPRPLIADGFDVGGLLGDGRGKDVVPAGCHQHVVFDAHADAEIAGVDVGSVRRDVDPRLDGQYHSRFQQPRVAFQLVFADVV